MLDRRAPSEGGAWRPTMTTTDTTTHPAPLSIEDLRPSVARPGHRPRRGLSSTARGPSCTAASTGRPAGGDRQGRQRDDVVRVIALARARPASSSRSAAAATAAAGHSVVDGGIVLDVSDMKAIDIDVDGPHRLGRAGLTAAELSHRARRARPGARVRRHGLGRDRRDHARRRRRLPRAQVRPDHRRPARRPRS